jgi:hypothetical protein
MPELIRTVDEVMAAEGRDMCFVLFGSWPFATEASPAARKRHLAWFATRGLRTETVAPEGWLEGNTGILAVHFDGPADPRLAATQRSSRRRMAGASIPTATGW